MNLILLGAPGAGKGTQAKEICKKFGIISISTGDMIRDALRSGSDLGLKVKSYMETGKLVPDDIVVDIVKERLKKDDCKNGFILDGFPRTIPQAEALDIMAVKIDKVIDIDTPDDVIVARISGRRVCEKCAAIYHMENIKPKVEGICDVCSGTLLKRKDDEPSTIMERLKVYHEQSEPLKDYYKKQGKLVSVDGTKGIKNATEEILKALVNTL